MQKKRIDLLDIVALLEDLPQKDLKCGEVGTVVEVLAPGVYEVEFSDNNGQTYAQFALRSEQMVGLLNRGERVEISVIRSRINVDEFNQYKGAE